MSDRTIDKTRVESPQFFDAVYVFGSVLTSQSPNDIDILLVYDDERLCEVEAARTRLEMELQDKLGDAEIHFTTLNRNEMQHTSFLELVHYVKLK